MWNWYLDIREYLLEPTGREPRSVRRFELVEQAKRFVLWLLLQESECLITYHILDVTAKLHTDAIRDHLRILVNTLPGQDDPLVEACRPRAKMPLACERRMITNLPKQVNEG